MGYRIKPVALAWGIAAALAFPTGAAAATNGAVMPTLPTGNNNSAVCNQLATGNTNGANQCRQENTATTTQSATATGGAGGTATGGNAGPVQIVGNGSHGGSFGGNAYANGGDAEAYNSADTEQSNQISGRDSSSESYVGEGNNLSDVCKQLATGNAQGNDQCHQSNTTTNTQSATATGGPGGSATGGNGGPVQVVGDDSEGSSYGGDAYANGGDAEAYNSADTEQSNQISGRDSSGSGHSGVGFNNSAVCNQLATGDTNAANQCRQDNTATNTQSATATGGAGGSATGGNGGPVQIVGNGSQGGSYGGDAYANGGDAEAYNSADTEQSNQISGRDSSGSGPGWVGFNNSAVCNLLATGSTFGDQCHQSNTATNTQSAAATGGAGGSATGGDAGPSQVTSDDYEGSSYGGDAYANGGDAEAYNSAETEQSNQISGRDSLRSDRTAKSKAKKAKKSSRRAKSRKSRFVS